MFCLSVHRLNAPCVKILLAFHSLLLVLLLKYYPIVNLVFWSACAHCMITFPKYFIHVFSANFLNISINHGCQLYFTLKYQVRKPGILGLFSVLFLFVCACALPGDFLLGVLLESVTLALLASPVHVCCCVSAPSTARTASDRPVRTLSPGCGPPSSAPSWPWWPSRSGKPERSKASSDLVLSNLVFLTVHGAFWVFFGTNLPPSQHNGLYNHSVS